MKRNITKLIAFTLAEVLITLGIIGIVAEMTIPTLTASYQNKVYLTSLQQFYSTFNQGMMQLKTKYDCSDLACAGVVATNNSAAAWRTNFDKEMKSVFKITESNETGIHMAPNEIKELSGALAGWGSFWVDNTSWYFYRTAQGALVGIHIANGTDCGAPDATNPSNYKQICSGVIFDTNGEKPPNQWGRDTWSSYVTIEGQLIPDYGMDYSKISSGSGWSTSSSYWRNASADDHCQTSFFSGYSGQACFARVMEDGWQMKY